jgi:hypothetical protein
MAGAMFDLLDFLLLTATHSIDLFDTPMLCWKQKAPKTIVKNPSEKNHLAQKYTLEKKKKILL